MGHEAHRQDLVIPVPDHLHVHRAPGIHVQGAEGLIVLPLVHENTDRLVLIVVRPAPLYQAVGGVLLRLRPVQRRLHVLQLLVLICHGIQHGPEGGPPVRFRPVCPVLQGLPAHAACQDGEGRDIPFIVGLLRVLPNERAIRLQLVDGRGEKGAAAVLADLRQQGPLLVLRQLGKHGPELGQRPLLVVPRRQLRRVRVPHLLHADHQGRGQGELRVPGLLPQPGEQLCQGPDGLPILQVRPALVGAVHGHVGPIRQGYFLVSIVFPSFLVDVPAQLEDVGRLAVALLRVAEGHGRLPLPLRLHALGHRPGGGGARVGPRRSRAHQHHRRQHSGQGGHPPGSFPVLHNRFQPLFQSFSALPEGQGRQGILVGPPLHGPQQGVPIGPPLPPVQALQRRLVAGELTGPADLPLHPPHQGVEPVEAHRGLDQPLVEHIPPPAVDQLVADRVPEVLLRQITARQDDAGPEKSQQQGRGDQAVDVQLHRPPHAGLLPGPGQRVQPRHVRHLLPAGPDILDKALVDGDLPDGQQRRRRQPDHPRPLRRRPNQRRRIHPGGDGAFLVLLCGGRRWQHGRVFPGNAAVRGLGLLRLPEERVHQACLRREGQQQPGHRHQPDVVLPPPADPVPVQGPAQEQGRDDQGAGQGQGEKSLE